VSACFGPGSATAPSRAQRKEARLPHAGLQGAAQNPMTKNRAVPPPYRAPATGRTALPRAKGTRRYPDAVRAIAPGPDPFEKGNERAAPTGRGAAETTETAVCGAVVVTLWMNDSIKGCSSST
jgi:hypothetical protein